MWTGYCAEGSVGVNFGPVDAENEVCLFIFHGCGQRFVDDGGKVC